MSSRFYFEKTTDCLEMLKIRNSILIYDEKLNQNHKEFIDCFTYKYEVHGGENLKNIDLLPQHLKNILNIYLKVHEFQQFIAFGGGSVTDFVGFIASTFHRGVPYFIIPSTWLCAVDSAHGGKNGLNIIYEENVIKNQIGTIHFPESIFLVSEVLQKPESRFFESLSEVLKIAWITGETIDFTNSKILFQNLDRVIEKKMSIVEIDPFGKKNIRHHLNLGHTLAHILEAKFSISHGCAVGLGLKFALLWSKHKNYLNQEDFLHHQKILEQILAKNSEFQLREEEVRDLFFADKKKMNGGINFIFIHSCKLNNLFSRVEAVSLQDFVIELRVQGYIHD